MLFNIWLACWIATNFFTIRTLNRAILYCEFNLQTKEPLLKKLIFYFICTSINFFIWYITIFVSINEDYEREFILGFYDKLVEVRKNNS